MAYATIAGQGNVYCKKDIYIIRSRLLPYISLQLEMLANIQSTLHVIYLCLYLLNSYPSELKNQAGLNQLPDTFDKGIGDCDKYL